ncbi:MAG: tRNA pseudouridine(38-40) synthase TruA [Actinomycetota bacterium]
MTASGRLFPDPDEPSLAALGASSALCRVRLLVAYDGRGFHGFAANPGIKTIGGTLITSIARVLGHEITITCAGRTDTGVHAWGQVVTFDARAEGLDLEALQRSVNKLCAPQIVVREAEVVDDDFDARRSALSRHYRYTVVNRPVPDPFMAGTAWHVEQPLELAALRLTCDPLIGEHDFSAFCRKPPARDASLVRRVIDAGWTDLGDGVLRFEIGASSFCHQMVRSLVGTMVEMGLGKRTAGEMASILRSHDRKYAGHLAPAHGLCLWEVRY